MEKLITQSDIKKEVERNKKAMDKAVYAAIDKVMLKQKNITKARD